MVIFVNFFLDGIFEEDFAVKAQDGKLIELEEKNEGAIPAEVYRKYLNSAGIRFVSLTLFFYFVEICGIVATDTYNFIFLTE
jgi:hypothetical protein